MIKRWSMMFGSWDGEKKGVCGPECFLIRKIETKDGWNNIFFVKGLKIKRTLKDRYFSLYNEKAKLLTKTYTYVTRKIINIENYQERINIGGRKVNSQLKIIKRRTELKKKKSEKRYRRKKPEKCMRCTRWTH